MEGVYSLDPLKTPNIPISLILIHKIQLKTLKYWVMINLITSQIQNLKLSRYGLDESINCVMNSLQFIILKNRSKHSSHFVKINFFSSLTFKSIILHSLQIHSDQIWSLPRFLTNFLSEFIT